MKVLRWSPVAVIGASSLLLRLPIVASAAIAAVASASASSSSGPEAAGAAADQAGALAPFEEDEEDEDEDEGERGVQGCVPDTCIVQGDIHLHFCSLYNYAEENSNYDDGNRPYPGCFYHISNPGASVLCAASEPTVIFLAHLGPCVDYIRSVNFEMFEDGRRIRRYTDKEAPYTVFGDKVSPFTVNSRLLALDSTYKLTATIKDFKGCVSLVQSYEFTVIDCTDDFTYDDVADEPHDDYYTNLLWILTGHKRLASQA